MLFLRAISPHARSIAAVTAVAALVVAAFVPGLGGAFMLDDAANLAPVGRWLRGEIDWWGAIASVRSGPLGRPIATASFIANAFATGLSPFAFKLVNVLLHVACGLALWRLLARLLRRDPALSAHAARVAAYLALLWALLPIQVSTVLYTVQRMSQLSALFCVLGMLSWIAARERLERAGTRAAIPALLAVPLLTLLAALSKENGLLLPLLVAALELGFFVPAPGARRPALVRLTLITFVLLPAIAAAAFLVLEPRWLLSGYESRPFTLAQRVLTQPRVLWDYAASILLPVGPRMGLIHDDYVVSTGLMSPWTTLAAILAWLGALAGAWALRRRSPAVLGGIALFLAGHAMESSIFPLEIYFEHRNYLPSIGLLLAIAALLNLALRAALATPTASFRRALLAAGVLLPACYFVATFARAHVWGSPEAILRQSLRYNRDSPRLHAMLAGHAMDRRDVAAAIGHAGAYERTIGPDGRATARLWALLAHCVAGSDPPQSDANWGIRNGRRLTLDDVNATSMLVPLVERGDCPPIDARALATRLEEMLAASPQADGELPHWRVRYYRARLLAQQSRWDEARTEARRAWHGSGDDASVGVLVFQLAATVGDRADAAATLAIIERNAPSWDRSLRDAVARFRSYLATPPEPG